MPDLLFDRQRTALVELRRLIEERLHGEEELAGSFTRREKAAVEKGERATRTLASQQERDLAQRDAAYQKDQEELAHSQAAVELAAQRKLQDDRQRLDTREQQGRALIASALKEALWMADSVAEGGQKRVQQQLESVQNQVADLKQRSAALWEEAEALLARFDLDSEDVEPRVKPPKADGDKTPDPAVPLNQAETVLRSMQRSRLLTWTRWTTAIVLGVAVTLVATVPAVFFSFGVLGWEVWALSAVVAGLLAAVLTRTICYGLARRRMQARGRKVSAWIAQSRVLATQLLAQTRTSAESQTNALRNKHDADRHEAERTHRPQLGELALRFQAERQAQENKFQDSSHARRQQDRQALELLRQRYEADRAQCLARQEKESQDHETAYAMELAQLRQARLQKTQQLRKHWDTEAARLLGVFQETAAANASGSVSATSVGTLTVDVRQMAGDLPDEKLAPFTNQALQLPAYLPFPRLGGLLLQAAGPGRTVAVQTLQALMLRLLTSLPPGKVRFTIFDPVGLGDNFAAFMHLADYDEALVTSRIWTEPAHVEKQLADLTGHMENVIQRYLRSQFNSIEDYNAEAGEVAEPYRVLVVANFPVNFTPQAARRLVSIVQSGSSCGVYALIGLDARQPLPQGFAVEDLEQLCLNLYWREERFRFSDEELDRYPLTLEKPPEANQLIETVRRIGVLSRGANQVRVPFSFIAPPREEIWQGDSRHGIYVPLGRAGAVARLSLQLGKGTSQHVLVAGKTGSGKSTLWHTLIANLALIYKPDEIELYLIDFKKGVEFKLYALHELPHARVIAIESEREFGLSVLQRLDAELRQRGDLFRAAGVYDIAGYRDNRPEERCPRIMLIVDEFQEFFIEDDRLSQEAALLLDRLVRQGRAFGLHVLLGSQTLGGAYSLARSTIDQMAVRIALQCSEADAQLILNKDNSAARLLSRPGEAIYNDSNGSIEGNEIFQVVWLPEEERDEILTSIQQRGERELPAASRRPPLVFEGNTPAELIHNPLLQGLLNQEELPARGIRAWLGEAIAIKDPTAAQFRAQTSDHLLLVGQNDEAALAILAAALVSLAVQQPSAQFVVLDGTAPHQPHAGYLKDLAEGWTQPMTLVDRPGLPAALAALAEEMNQRLKGNVGDRGARFLLINGLQAYREFRRGDDEMAFSRRGAERTVSPLEHLQALLRDGPVVGIHALIWCDSLVNVMRSLDRAGLRECGQRVLFQMSAADSSHLLDSPIASRLGRNRALYYTDEMAQPEKFRPYGLPSLAWLTEVKQTLSEKRKPQLSLGPAPVS
jgi:DNA segregation ATPase FtsK/SpoIIIE, S-DNA-T family